MKFQALLATAALAFAVVQAQSPAKPPDEPVNKKAAKKFQPSFIGCIPRAVVDDKGKIAIGINPQSPAAYKCPDLPAGENSLVYARSDWVKGRWGMMFMYHSGLEVEDPFALQSIVVFINNPAVENPKIIACSLSRGNGQYAKYEPCPKHFIAGETVMLEYNSPMSTSMDFTTTAMDAKHMPVLTTWNELSDAARLALNETAKGRPYVPMNDLNFQAALQNAR